MLLACGMSRADLEAAADRADARLDEIRRDVLAAATRVRDHGADAARDGLPTPLLLRLEGAGVLRGGTFASWSGTPEEPDGYPDGQGVRILGRGMRTSLLASSAPGTDGTRGVASFVLEIRSGAVVAEELLPSDPAGIAVHWDPTGAAPETAPAFDAGPPASLSRPSRSLGTLVVEELPASVRTSRGWARARAWGGIALAALAAILLVRPRRAVSYTHLTLPTILRV